MVDILYIQMDVPGILKHVLWVLHRLHSTFEKIIIERAIEYAKDRTEDFDDYYIRVRKKSVIYYCLSMDNIIHVYGYAVKSHLKFSIINELIGGENP
jgi:hypothetical protein